MSEREVTDAQVEAASIAFGGLVAPNWADADDWERDTVRASMRRALEAARGVTSEPNPHDSHEFCHRTLGCVTKPAEAEHD